mgnify:CR=1 FL=1
MKSIKEIYNDLYGETESLDEYQKIIKTITVYMEKKYGLRIKTLEKEVRSLKKRSKYLKLFNF